MGGSFSINLERPTLRRPEGEPFCTEVFFNKVRVFVVIVQFLSHVQLSVTPWTAARQVCLSFTISQSWLKFVFLESVMLSNHLILCLPLLLLHSIFSSIRVFSNELTLCIKWSEYWSFSISPSSEYSGLIFFRMD